MQWFRKSPGLPAVSAVADKLLWDDDGGILLEDGVGYLLLDLNTVVWESPGAVSGRWSQGSVDPCPPPWAQVRMIPASPGMPVNFVIRLQREYASTICHDRPWIITTAFTGNAP